MDKIISGGMWKQVSKLIHGGSKVAAIAYVSKGSPLGFGEGDTLVCDASDEAIKSGQTDAATLGRFLKAGTTLFSCPRLHAKLLVSGKLTVIGSANLSASAQETLVEAMLATDRQRVRSQALAFLYELVRHSRRIDERFIARASSLPVERRRRVRRVRPPSIGNLGDRTWIVNTRPIPDKEDEAVFIERGEKRARQVLRDPEAEIEWMRWTGNFRFRQIAKPGDTVVEIVRVGKRATVSNPRAILFRQNHGSWTRFYLEPESSHIPWSAFQKELKRSGLDRRIRKSSVRELSSGEAAFIESILEVE